MINADTDSPLVSLANGATVDLTMLPTRNLNVRAEVGGTESTESVRFDYDGTMGYRVENAAPHALAGDTEGDYNAWTPAVGSHSLSAVPFSGPDMSGSSGDVFSINFTVTNGSGSGNPGGFVGRIAVSADGNQVDQDDWGATALTLAMLADSCLQSRVVHYDFNSHIWDSASGWEEEMQESALGGADRFGFDRSIFFDDMENLSGAIASITRQVNASSQTDPLYLILAGPTEVVWRGINGSDSSRRQYVTVISHSAWNNDHAREHGAHDANAIEALGVRFVQIRDQNAGLAPNGMTQWEWLRASSDPNLKWVYERIAAVEHVGDASDAGMIYHLLTNDESGTPSKLQSRFTSTPTCGSGGGVPAESVYPAGTWQTSSPAAEGLDPTKFKMAMDTLPSPAVVVRHGKIIGSKGDIARSGYIWSASKSLTALIAGRLIQQGRIRYDDLVPGSDRPSGPLASYRHFMSMTSDFGLSPHSPGGHFAYNNGGVTHYCDRMEETFFSGQGHVQMLRNAYLDTIGHEDQLGFADRCSGWGGGWRMSTRDLARVGYLVLRDGTHVHDEHLTAQLLGKLECVTKGVLGCLREIDGCQNSFDVHYVHLSRT